MFDGDRIAQQVDRFDFPVWAAQALGLPGKLFGRFRRIGAIVRNSSRQIRNLRTGLAAGMVVARDGDFYGPVVNLAARALSGADVAATNGARLSRPSRGNAARQG